MSYGRFTESSVTSCNVSYREAIDAETLVSILSGEVLSGDWQAHIEVFFNEMPHDYVIGVMKENNLTMGQLIAAFESLPKVFQDKHFRELAYHE